METTNTDTPVGAQTALLLVEIGCSNTAIQTALLVDVGLTPTQATRTLSWARAQVPPFSGPRTTRM